MINNFIYEFLNDLEYKCKRDIDKAILCGVPIVKNEILIDSLTFSYDSFRRIFLTKESNGRKTTKNMFAVYLGFNNYTDLWVKEMTKYPIQLDLADFYDPNLLFQGGVTSKLAQYFEYSILSMLGLAIMPSKPLLIVLTEKKEISLELLTILEGIYFFSKREWYLSSDCLNRSHHFFFDYYQFYFIAGISFYKIKYGNYGAKQAERYLEKAVSLIHEDLPNSIKSSVNTFYGAILMYNKNFDKSLYHLKLGLSFATTELEYSKVYYYLSCFGGKTGNVGQALVATDFLRDNSGKYYALAMNYLKLNARDMYEKFKYKGGYNLVDFNK